MRSTSRSGSRIVYSTLPINLWLNEESLPSTDAARPPACPVCGATSRPVGEGLLLHGHGLRRRELRGPRERGGKPVVVEVLGRRYACRGCSAVCLVVPREVLPRRRFGAGAIALALALWGEGGLTATQAREEVAGGCWFEGGWRSLRRWASDVAQGRLFEGFAERRKGLEGVSLRSVAKHLTSWLAGFAPPGSSALPLTWQAQAGAGQVG